MLPGSIWFAKAVRSKILNNVLQVMCFRRSVSGDLEQNNEQKSREFALEKEAK